MKDKTNEIRESTLSRIERSERFFKIVLTVVALLEIGFIAAFILLADFSNRTHVLLLICGITVYTILGFGMIALGLHISQNTLRVLNAVELLQEED